MKKYKYIALMLLCVAAITSCGKDDDDDNAVKYAEWKLENEVAFQAIEADPAYTELKSLGNDGSIYYKVQKEGTSQTPIYYTDSVRVYYTGWTIDNSTPFNEYEPPYNDPQVFHVSVGSSTIAGVIEGWSIALQNMHIGDRWDIWIPQNLAYGSTGNKSQQGNYYLILPFSTLHYEIEVVEIIRDGKVISE